MNSVNDAIRDLVDEVQGLHDYIRRHNDLPWWPVAPPPEGGWPQDTERNKMPSNATDNPESEHIRQQKREAALSAPTGSGYRLTIEAVGLRQSDAAAYALRLIGSMMQEAHTKGHSCGGETGSASGNWENVGIPNDPSSATRHTGAENNQNLL